MGEMRDGGREEGAVPGEGAGDQVIVWNRGAEEENAVLQRTGGGCHAAGAGAGCSEGR